MDFQLKSMSMKFQYLDAENFLLMVIFHLLQDGIVSILLTYQILLTKGVLIPVIQYLYLVKELMYLLTKHILSI